MVTIDWLKEQIENAEEVRISAVIDLGYKEKAYHTAKRNYLEAKKQADDADALKNALIDELDFMQRQGG
ncbi:hypothetical protein AGMMS49991_11890 [Spirochaetia bacterium]|nr:hypothetical protein AGMMS49991_11890 [Spirochaetia bacterium]